METIRRAALYGSNDHPSAASLLDTLKQRAEGLNPSALGFVKQALSVQPDSPDMHFASAVMTRQPQRPDYQEHASKARAAKSNALLAANIHSHLE